MGLARSERVIALIGSPTEEQEQEGMDIAGALLDADRIVYDFTRKRDWVAPDPDNDIEGDTGFAWAQDAAERWAAARLLDEWKGDEVKVDRLRKQAMEDLTTLRKIGYGTIDSDNPSFYSTVTAYKTRANNSAALNGHTLDSGTGIKRYRSDNAFGGYYD